MVQLFLSEPSWKDNGDDEYVKKQATLLKELQSTIWSLVTSSGGRPEARLWLCDSLSLITSVPSHRQDELFMKILRSKPVRRAPLAQVLQLIFEKQPRKAGYILSKKSHLLEDFFRDNPRRIMQWFSTFASGGNSGHTKGAKALSQFAFVNRDICWDELEWKGKHGQSPAMVATKPHYFLDLDVQQSVENFLEHVPEFWTSDEFADSLKSGEILFIDKQYFLDFFVGLMLKEDSKEVWELVSEFLEDEPFDSLCRHLLIILEERQFSEFLELFGNFMNPRNEPMHFEKSWQWLEMLLSKGSDYISIEELLFLNAVISQGRRLLRLINEEDNKEQKLKIENIVAQISSCSIHPCTLVETFTKSSNMKTVERVKWLGVKSWALHYRLTEEFQSPEIWESLFRDNGIKFRRDKKYELLNHDSFVGEWDSNLDERGSSKVRKKRKEHRKRWRKNSDDELINHDSFVGEWDSDFDERGSSRKKKKKKERRKRTRKNSDEDDSYNDDVNIDMLGKGLSLKSGAASWLLSTDGNTMPWTSVDLPEHISRHCFSTWMKWTFTK